MINDIDQNLEMEVALSRYVKARMLRNMLSGKSIISHSLTERVLDALDSMGVDCHPTASLPVLIRALREAETLWRGEYAALCRG